jgi:hypothetical protein
MPGWCFGAGTTFPINLFLIISSSDADQSRVPDSKVKYTANKQTNERINSTSMSAGRSTTISFRPADIRQIKDIHYFAGIPWMLIPGDKGVAHLAIFTDTSPPVTRDIADDVIFSLYTK